MVLSKEINLMTDIVWCECDWMDPEVEATPACGCGAPSCVCRLYRDHVIHWRGKHWKIECAFRQANKELESFYEKENR